MATFLSDRIIHLRPCDEGVIWLRIQSKAKEAYKNCRRGDWLLWLWARVIEENSQDHKKLVLCCCKIARAVLHLVPTKEERPRIALETAEAWCRGETKISEVRDAADAAYSAACAADADADAAAYAAASAAVYATRAITIATYAASAAVYATRAITIATYAVNAVYLRTKQRELKRFAKIVREFFPNPPTLKRIQQCRKL